MPVDAVHIATAAGTYFGLKDLVPRILGPSADYLGEGLKGLTEKGVQNITRVFHCAERKLGAKINSPGQVPPRVVKTILTEAYFCDSEVAMEYFGGILASSRSNDARDDRGAYFAAIVAGLSTYQIRSHYVLYHCFKRVFDGKRLPFTHMELREKAAVFIPATNYVDAMDCKRYEGMTPYLDHACVGLIKESLISDYFAKGESRLYRLQPPTGLEHEKVLGIVAAPTHLGLELFLWSHGEGWQPVHQFFFHNNQFEVLRGVNLSFDGVKKIPSAKNWGPENEPAPI